MALRSSFDDISRADRASAILAIVGIVNVVIVKKSVDWWNSLHQGQTLSVFGESKMDSSMIVPLLVMMLAFLLFFGSVLCDGLRAEILRRERNASWLADVKA
jgi:heme exporter protein C